MSTREAILGMALGWMAIAGVVAQQTPPKPALPPEATRPPENNDQALRPLGPTEIPPNLSFYAVDPLYKPGVPLGWADTRIVETLDRGLVAVSLSSAGVPAGGTAIDGDRVYLSWRLLQSDPEGVGFTVYRGTGGAAVKLSAQPVLRTTDFVDNTASRDREHTWWVVPVVKGREQAPSERVTLPAQRPSQAYRALKLREDIRSVDRVGIGDLDGDGAYDFVVKHPTGRIDPGTRVPSTDTYKIDAYNGRTGTFMWRIDLGWNINHGIWFSPMVVRDLDGALRRLARAEPRPG